jgi:hypothetical protein
MLATITGSDTDIDELTPTGNWILVMRNIVTLREGFNPSYYQLPSGAAGNSFLTAEIMKNISIDIQSIKKGANKALGCDPIGLGFKGQC